MLDFYLAFIGNHGICTSRYPTPKDKIAKRKFNTYF